MGSRSAAVSSACARACSPATAASPAAAHSRRARSVSHVLSDAAHSSAVVAAA
ncbi:hypothetical protein [Actinoplanes nipponensis]|uniref:hypothetical protein n=1 Tax=Actinoplanes nipponensis TaxID=135950 RepID=UPI0031ED0647